MKDRFCFATWGLEPQGLQEDMVLYNVKIPVILTYDGVYDIYNL